VGVSCQYNHLSVNSLAIFRLCLKLLQNRKKLGGERVQAGVYECSSPKNIGQSVQVEENVSYDIFYLALLKKQQLRHNSRDVKSS